MISMYYDSLDRWDENRAKCSDKIKHPAQFELGANLAFSNAGNNVNVEQFCSLSERTVRDPTFFEEPAGARLDFQFENGWVTFPSSLTTSIKENNTVWARVTKFRSSSKALIVFHHWNASSRQKQISRFLAIQGITVVEMALPYHFERSRPGSSYSDFMLCPNLGRTIQSVKQAVWDGRKLIRFLKQNGYSDISVLGLSLGSWVAGLVAAHDRSVSKASLFLSSGSLASMVWTGRATRLIRKSIEPNLSLTDLDRAWAPINLNNYGRNFSRPNFNLSIVLARRDKVMLPQHSYEFIEGLRAEGVGLNVSELNCGHYSLALPPYIVMAGLGLRRFLFDPHNS